ncbi:MAG: ABC transporter permease [Actinobacteria bacterium]|nr:ABC transporter permease [Actinomycetota bacterium]
MKIKPLVVAKRIVLDLRNDKRTLVLIFLAPIFAMFVFGLAFSGEISDLRVEVINKDQGSTTPAGNLSLSEVIIENIDKNVLSIEALSNEDEAIQKVKDGKAYAIIVFPEDFTASAVSKLQDPGSSQSAVIELMQDNTIVNISAAVVKALNEALQKTVEQAGFKPAVSVNTSHVIYGKGAKFMDSFVPGVMAFAVFLLTTLLTLISFVGERSSGTLARMFSTPLTETDIVLGYSTAFGVVGIVQSAVLLAVGVLVFKITIVGNIFLAFLVIALLAIVSQALGILLSSFARREAQVVQFIPFIILPVFLLSGIFWPIEAIPSWLRPLSYAIPPTYAVNAMRDVMLRGWGFSQIWQGVLALIIFAVVFLALATFSLKIKKS